MTTINREENNLQTWCKQNNREDLLAEWDDTKNSLDPSSISPKSSKKAWWKCSLEHEWYSTIGSRTSGRMSSCPFCSNPPKRVMYGFNDFETWCINNRKTQLLNEWNYEKNTTFSPQEITYGCGKKVWWKCSKGHEWCVPPSNRTQGTGCPVCSRTQTSFPEQAIAFYLSKSFNILQRYRKNGYELDIYLVDYSLGIEYDGMFYHTERNAEREFEIDCFYDKQGITVIHIKEDKKTCIENNTIYYEPPHRNYVNEDFDEMVVSLLSLIEKHAGIKTNEDVNIVRDELVIRERYASIINSNSVAAMYPNLISEWDTKKNNGMTPENFSANSHTKVWWKCNWGHSWQADISSRKRNGCPYCAGQKIIRGENDFESWCKDNNSVLLNEWCYERNTRKPSEIPHTHKEKVWWECANGHLWQATVYNRINGTGCPLCNKGRATKGGKHIRVSLLQWCKDNDSQLYLEWHPTKNGELTPESVSYGCHNKVWWICTNGHEWEAQVKSRTYNHGCPYCSGTNKKAEKGVNDLQTWCNQNNRRELLEEWDYESNNGMSPDMFTYGSHKRIFWKCKNGHKWSAVIKDRTKSIGSSCPQCKKYKL